MQRRASKRPTLVVRPEKVRLRGARAEGGRCATDPKRNEEGRANSETFESGWSVGPHSSPRANLVSRPYDLQNLKVMGGFPSDRATRGHSVSRAQGTTRKGRSDRPFLRQIPIAAEFSKR